MRRFSFVKAMERSEGTLTTFPDSVEFSTHRRQIMMDIARLRLEKSKLDFLAGQVEAFILDNGHVVVRQFISYQGNRNEIKVRIHWYHVWQGDIHLIDNHIDLEKDYYANLFKMG